MGSLQPWQLFTLLFGVCCTIVRYFNSFLMTIIVCVAFGGVAEVVSKYLYVWKKPTYEIVRKEQTSKVSSTRLDDETDEELEEEYANIEVNFDESETEEEDYVPEQTKDVSEHNLDNQIINVTEEEIAGEQSVEYNDGFDNQNLDNSNNDIHKDYFDESELYEDDLFLGDTKYTGDIPVSRGKSFIQDTYIETDTKKDIDINLTDPAVMAAAVKIQSVFKGFRVRRNAQGIQT